MRKGKTLAERRLFKANELLRRVYGVIEMSHLNDHKLNPNYCGDFRFTRSLGEGIFNHLQNDEIFQRTTMRRQKRYRLVKKKTMQYNLENGI
jgi:hypothetical protein